MPSVSGFLSRLPKASKGVQSRCLPSGAAGGDGLNGSGWLYKGFEGSLKFLAAMGVTCWGAYLAASIVASEDLEKEYSSDKYRKSLRILYSFAEELSGKDSPKTYALLYEIAKTELEKSPCGEEARRLQERMVAEWLKYLTSRNMSAVRESEKEKDQAQGVDSRFDLEELDRARRRVYDFAARQYAVRSYYRYAMLKVPFSEKTFPLTPYSSDRVVGKYFYTAAASIVRTMLETDRAHRQVRLTNDTKAVLRHCQELSEPPKDRT